ncbi:Protein CBR-ZIG-3 [Caenorhabditis briggsae]|uniref:Ig-like domain-containing protein n=2 Tax=Caenorhabditis briggsae TaxID=6238 RepID=A0AAE8ZSU1_CAEBR|nr:Protein CBR-ZIG-3 [Caenorhabditis briggsae]ULT83304.1 hypothetical protein L3Y34_012503 [Caenorhabditis briggsae]UMM42583.1 hypothetical protein L5515_018358 [Caenorhabditis briggsae]CAP34708.2 Protein CBR-ZIG-3 [Caenorhabditis briggsae]
MMKLPILLLLAAGASTAPSKMDELVVELDKELTHKPLIKTTVKLEDVTLQAGQSAVLHCEILSIPSAVIFWEKNGKLVQGDRELNIFEKLINTGKPLVDNGIVSSNYHIPCATHNDTGVYKCIGYNGHKRIESTAVVEIEGTDAKCPSNKHTAPMITLQTESRFEMSGNAATLVCRANKKATWSWTFDGDAIYFEEGRHEILPTGDLLIRNISWSDMGDYFCTAKNKYGVAEGETFLYPTKRTT